MNAINPLTLLAAKKSDALKKLEEIFL